jgi:hypothetical protein
MNEQSDPEAFARQLFTERNGMWPKPLFDILFEISPLLPMRVAIEVSHRAIDGRSSDLRQDVAEFLDILLNLERLLSQTAGALQEISNTVWICKGGAYLERRGLARLFGALAQLKRENEKEYRLETIRGLSLLADNMEGEWFPEVLEYTLDSFRLEINRQGDISKE